MGGALRSVRLNGTKSCAAVRRKPCIAEDGAEVHAAISRQEWRRRFRPIFKAGGLLSNAPSSLIQRKALRLDGHKPSLPCRARNGRRRSGHEDVGCWSRGQSRCLSTAAPTRRSLAPAMVDVGSRNALLSSSSALAAAASCCVRMARLGRRLSTTSWQCSSMIPPERSQT